MSAGRRVAHASAVACAVLLTTVLAAVPAAAQSAARGGRIEVSGGGALIGGYDLGRAEAELTPNSGSSGGFDLFTTESEVRRSFGVSARVGFVVSPAFVVEAGFRFSRPVLEVLASGDAESAPDTTIDETLSQYVFDGSLVWNFRRARGRVVPFVFGGAGYLRELHQQGALVEEGLEYHAGGGVKWWFGEGGRRFGARGDVGISIRDGGFDFSDGQRVVPIVGGSVVYSF